MPGDQPSLQAFSGHPGKDNLVCNTPPCCGWGGEEELLECIAAPSLHSLLPRCPGYVSGDENCGVNIFHGTVTGSWVRMLLSKGDGTRLISQLFKQGHIPLTCSNHSEQKSQRQLLLASLCCLLNWISAIPSHRSGASPFSDVLTELAELFFLQVKMALRSSFLSYPIQKVVLSHTSNGRTDCSHGPFSFGGSRKEKQVSVQEVSTASRIGVVNLFFHITLLTNLPRINFQ